MEVILTFEEVFNMKALLTKLNVKYDKSDDPVLHYVINSELTKAELINLPDSALYITKDNLVKIIIPNFHTVTDCSYFPDKYPDLYFSRPYNSSIADIGKIFLEGEYCC